MYKKYFWGVKIINLRNAGKFLLSGFIPCFGEIKKFLGKWRYFWGNQENFGKMKKFLGAKKTLSAIVFFNCSLTDCQIRNFFISLNDIIFHGKFRSFGKISFVHKNEAYNFCRYLIRIMEDSSSIFLSLRSIGGDRSKQNSRNLPP